MLSHSLLLAVRRWNYFPVKKRCFTLWQLQNFKTFAFMGIHFFLGVLFFGIHFSIRRAINSHYCLQTLIAFLFCQLHSAIWQTQACWPTKILALNSVLWILEMTLFYTIRICSLLTMSKLSDKKYVLNGSVLECESHKDRSWIGGTIFLTYYSLSMSEDVWKYLFKK